jgi:hypothetical protein
MLPLLASTARRLVPVLLLCVAALGGQCVHAATPGDVDGDGKVTVADATIAVKLALGLSADEAQFPAAADVAPYPGVDGRKIGDGKITIADATRIIGFALGLISADQFAPKDPAPTQPSLSVDQDAAQDLIRAGLKEITIPIRLTDVHNVAVGRAKVTVAPSAATPSAPPIKIVRVTAGEMLPETATFLTSPDPIPQGGVDSVTAGFIVPPSDALTGTGVAFNFVVAFPDNVPAGSRYNVTISTPSFADMDSDAVLVAVANGVLAVEPKS